MPEELRRRRRRRQQQEQAEEDRGGRQVHRAEGVLAFGQLFPRTVRRTSGRLTALLTGRLIY